MAKLSSCDRIYMDTTPEIFTRVCVCVCVHSVAQSSLDSLQAYGL